MELVESTGSARHQGLRGASPRQRARRSHGLRQAVAGLSGSTSQEYSGIYARRCVLSTDQQRDRTGSAGCQIQRSRGYATTVADELVVAYRELRAGGSGNADVRQPVHADRRVGVGCHRRVLRLFARCVSATGAQTHTWTSPRRRYGCDADIFTSAGVENREQ